MFAPIYFKAPILHSVHIFGILLDRKFFWSGYEFIKQPRTLPPSIGTFWKVLSVHVHKFLEASTVRQ